MDFSTACTLTEEELRERRRTVLDILRHAALDIASIPNGYVYSFEQSLEMLTQLGRLVELERQCCRFLTFNIVAESAEQTIQLEISGPPEARSVIKDFFGGPSGEKKIAKPPGTF